MERRTRLPNSFVRYRLHESAMVVSCFTEVARGMLDARTGGALKG
jgi:hypothetical protein